MRWRKSVQAHVYLAVGAVMVLVISTGASAGDPTSTKVPMTSMNKTVQNIVRKRMFLENIKRRLTNKTSFNVGLMKSLNSSARPTLSTGNPKNKTDFITQVPSSKEVPRSKILPITVLKSGSLERNMLKFQIKSSNKRNTTVTRITLWVYLLAASPKKRKREFRSTMSSSQSRPSNATDDLKGNKLRKRREGRMIKIRVFMSGANGTRGQRIAELKKRVKNNGWEKLGLPVSLARILSNKLNNNTLHLRIECKRCSRKTQLITPFDSRRCQRKSRLWRRKKKEKKLRRWRKFCAEVKVAKNSTDITPFIVLENKNTGRSKRASEFGVSKPELSYTECRSPNVLDGKLLSSLKPPSNIKFNTKGCCTTSKTFISFSDLGLDDVIVSPTGFDYISCADTCPGSLGAHVSTPQDDKHSLERLFHVLSHKIRVQLNQKSPRPPQQTSPRVYSHSPQPQHKRRDHWHSHKWRRSKIKHQLCRPLETQSLVILHFTYDHKLTTSELPNFLTTRCGCKGYLP